MLYCFPDANRECINRIGEGGKERKLYVTDGEKDADLARRSLRLDSHAALLLSFTNIAPLICEKRVLKWDFGYMFIHLQCNPN